MATFTWKTGTSGDWNTAANWGPSGIPNSDAADVVIDALPVGGGDYTVTIAAGESQVVHSVTMNAVNNKLTVNQHPYSGAVLAVDGTLTFAPGSDGTFGGSLQTMMTMNNGTIVNAGTVDAFVQAVGDSYFTGTNGIYFTNWVQALGTLTIDTTSIAELDGTNLFDGIFEAQGPGATIYLGGKLGGLNVNIVSMEGPPLIPEGWTELILKSPGSAIYQWNGTKYVPIEQTLTTINSRSTLDVLGGRDYTTTNALNIGSGGLINLEAGTLATGGLNIAAGGQVQGSATITGDMLNNGTVLVSGGEMILTGAVTGSGAINFGAPGGTLEVGAVGANETITMQGGDTLRLRTPAAFAGSISARTGDNIVLQGISATSATFNDGTLIVSNGTQTVASLRLSGSYAGETFNVSTTGGGTQVNVAPVCFARGTRILTTDGVVAVEDLAVGQHAVTASGAAAPIIWIGRRRIDCTQHPEPHKVWPVRINAGAFAPNVPCRDLFVSPQHAIFAEGVLVPAKCLVNGLNVVQQEMDSVEYFHVELEQHDILFSEALPTESYLENGDRDMFENGGGVMRLHPDFSTWTWDARACAELKVVGPEVDAIRATLRKHAGTKRRAQRRAA